MSEPGTMGLAEDFSESLENRSTLEKMYEVAIQLYENRRVSDIAERADVTPETARKYLEFLTEVGVLIQTGENPDEFARNEAYFEWRETDRLRREYSVAELESRLADLSKSIKRLKDRYGTTSPETIDPREEGYDKVDEVYSDIRRWWDVQEEIDRILSVLRSESELALSESTVSRWQQAAQGAADQLHSQSATGNRKTERWLSSGMSIDPTNLLALINISDYLSSGPLNSEQLRYWLATKPLDEGTLWDPESFSLSYDMPEDRRLEEFATPDAEKE